MTTESILMGLLGMAIGALLVYFPLQKRMAQQGAQIAGLARDVKTLFRDGERDARQLETCMECHQETTKLIRTVVDQNNLLIQKVITGG